MVIYKAKNYQDLSRKAAKEEFFNSENNYIDPQYEEMAEGFDAHDTGIAGTQRHQDHNHLSSCVKCP